MDTPAQSVNNRRSAERFPLAWTAVLPRGEARTRDISTTGLYLEMDTAEPLPPGQTIQFVLRSPDRHHARDLWCWGRVVRVDQHAQGIGLGVELERFQFGT